jgi:hypothetical protein
VTTKLLDKEIANIRDLRRSGHSYREIGIVTGHSVYAARNYCLGIPVGVPPAEVLAARALEHQASLARRRASRKPRPGKFTDRQILIAMAVLEAQE